ncbi:MAG: DUF2961 domain-containing protein [Planctomycetes bacterium]|nr:DUF2961 domain-containing protein [Planctomycetota bacterium]
MRPLVRVRVLAVVFPVLAVATARGQQPATLPVTTTSLLEELVDLDRLMRLPRPRYRTVQFSSSDRRTLDPDRPGWFANADGFGQEPMPGFAGVVRVPGANGIGEFLVCDLDGPGAIVRGWSAGMDGELRVWLDGSDAPLFVGKGYDFFARRTAHLLPQPAAIADAGIRAALEPQQDADYLPIPFAKRLRITWTGRISELHFYQLQVRRYDAGAVVQSFDAATIATMRSRPEGAEADTTNVTAAIELPVDGVFAHRHDVEAPTACRELALRLDTADPIRALRGVLLSITCDDASVPQVEAPLGDFFASAPGITPHHSLPIDVETDGTLVARWVMPYRSSWRLELHNHSGLNLTGTMRCRHARLDGGFGDDGLYFHARWRVDHELAARAGKAPIDLPYLTAVGSGRLVGVGCQIVNPPMQPAWRSNWWGEGDERFAVDGRVDTFGTGTEDYFNYSWSHWRYFAHPYCGQPICSGPGNCGYVANHRFQIIDDLPFDGSLALSMELWTHRAVEPLSYGRITWFYARPGVLTDHRRPQPAELVVPPLSPWQPDDLGTNAGATSRTWRPGVVPGGYRAIDGEVAAQQPNAWTRSGAILSWQAPAGGRLELPFTVAADGRYRLRLCCQQRPDAPAVRCEVDGTVRAIRGSTTHELGCVHGQRFEDLVFGDVDLVAGEHVLTVVCPEGGRVGIDLVGLEPLPPPEPKLPGASEAELWDIVQVSDGVDVEVQHLGAGWSAGHQRWVKATATGQQVTFRVPATGADRTAVVLRLTTSRDYGVLRVDWNGEPVAADIDTWGGPDRRIRIRELDLGERDLSRPVELRFTVTGHAKDSEAPHYYFGIDCLIAKVR